jgi:hypothetical protein
MHQSPGSCTPNGSVVTIEWKRRMRRPRVRRRDRVKGASVQDTRRAENLKKLEVKPGCRCCDTLAPAEERHSSTPSFCWRPKRRPPSCSPLPHNMGDFHILQNYVTDGLLLYTSSRSEMLHLDFILCLSTSLLSGVCSCLTPVTRYSECS